MFLVKLVVALFSFIGVCFSFIGAGIKLAIAGLSVLPFYIAYKLKHPFMKVVIALSIITLIVPTTGLGIIMWIITFVFAIAPSVLNRFPEAREKFDAIMNKLPLDKLSALYIIVKIKIEPLKVKAIAFYNDKIGPFFIKAIGKVKGFFKGAVAKVKAFLLLE